MYPGKVSRNHFLPGYGSCFSRCGFGSPLYTLPLNSTSIPDILISASIFYISETSSFQNFETSKKKKKRLIFDGIWPVLGSVSGVLNRWRLPHRSLLPVQKAEGTFLIQRVPREIVIGKNFLKGDR